MTDDERRILLELINNPSVPYDALVVNLGISRRTVSRVFSSLEEKGFIDKDRNEQKGILEDYQIKGQLFDSYNYHQSGLKANHSQASIT